MKLTTSRPVEREIDYAIGELAAGKIAHALRRLCELRGLPIPAVKARRRVSRVQTLPDGSLKVCGKTPVVLPVMDGLSDRIALRREERARETVTPIPKPHKRHIDRDNLAAFAERFPSCAILGCRSTGDIDTHHIRKRSAGGGDQDENLLRLHRVEHDEWHRIGREAFLAKYARRLAPLDLLKIRLAAEYEATAALNVAVDEDA